MSNLCKRQGSILQWIGAAYEMNRAGYIITWIARISRDGVRIMSIRMIICIGEVIAIRGIAGERADVIV